ncbi:flavin reductase family protein [uncultured Alsobacter sp.]|uniref:flavin reductase family protein n=1 Tax=uncultured Alsobacter sp. TaxID=1748258 RepID=UPI0025D84EB9|nr:flavin reductase family protein [uncultured Alsobacter sp.]
MLDLPPFSAHPASAQPVADPASFRQAMRELAGHVSVIATGSGAARTGFTATSVSSLSAEPPTLLVCLNRASSSYPVLSRSGAFTVNVLHAGQQSVAERFSGAGGLKGLARYEGADWLTLASGAPALAGASAVFDCVVDELIERHTHAIVIGKVLAATTEPGFAALLYRNGRYGS